MENYIFINYINYTNYYFTFCQGDNLEHKVGLANS